MAVSAEEMRTLKTQKSEEQGAVLHLLGFRDKSRLKCYHNIRTSYFLAADEEHVGNSS